LHLMQGKFALVASYKMAPVELAYLKK